MVEVSLEIVRDEKDGRERWEMSHRLSDQGRLQDFGSGGGNILGGRPRGGSGGG